MMYNNEIKNFNHTIFVQNKFKGIRIDIFLSKLLIQYSRSKVIKFLKNEYILVNGKKKNLVIN